MMIFINSTLSAAPPGLFVCRCPTMATRTVGRTTNLIPVVVPTMKVVCANVDPWMEWLRQQRNSRVQVNENSVGDTILHEAARRGQLANVHQAVNNNKALLLHMNKDGNLPLHLAVERGHKQVVSYLVEQLPVSSCALNRAGVCPLYLAVDRGYKDVVENMLQKLRRYNLSLMKGKSIVHASITRKNLDTLQLILRYQPELVKSHDEEGRTPLSHAAFKGYDRIVTYFLEKVPQSVNIRDADRSYPIHKACLGGNIDILKLFHSHYPGTIFSTDGHGRTVLHIAAKEPRDKLEKVVTWLLTLPNSGTLITSRDADRLTPSELADRARNKKVLAKISIHSRPR